MILLLVIPHGNNVDYCCSAPPPLPADPAHPTTRRVPAISRSRCAARAKRAQPRPGEGIVIAAVVGNCRPATKSRWQIGLHARRCSQFLAFQYCSADTKAERPPRTHRLAVITVP